MTEIRFPHSFEHDADLPIPLGRIIIGEYIMRLMFFPDGKVRALVPQAAVDDKSLILTPRIPEGTIFGFNGGENEK